MRRGGPGGPPGSRHSAITKASLSEPITCPDSRGATFGELQLKKNQPRLHVKKRLVEIGDDVFDFFDADGKAHEALGDAHALLNFFGHGSVSHHRRKRN